MRGKEIEERGAERKACLGSKRMGGLDETQRSHKVGRECPRRE
jgi:hypothetical protein